MTKMQAYEICRRHGGEASWIANVVLCGHSRAALKLKAMAWLLNNGHSISLPSFSMPDTGIWVDGYQTSWDDVLLLRLADDLSKLLDRAA